MNKLLFLLLIPTACCTDPELNVIEPELESYYFSFVHEATIRYKAILIDGQLTIRFGNLGGNRFGHTSKSGNETIITIDRRMFDQEKNLDDKERAMFHEFGHGILGRWDHLNTLNEDGEPISIMSELPITDYASRREELLNELYGKEVVNG